MSRATFSFPLGGALKQMFSIHKMVQLQQKLGGLTCLLEMRIQLLPSSPPPRWPNMSVVAVPR